MKVEKETKLTSGYSYLPEYSSFDSMAIDIDGVILCSDEAILHQCVPKRVDSIPICPPSKDLDPSYFSLLLRSVRSTEQN